MFRNQLHHENPVIPTSHSQISSKTLEVLFSQEPDLYPVLFPSTFLTNQNAENGLGTFLFKIDPS